jgi:hypothetical protein
LYGGDGPTTLRLLADHEDGATQLLRAWPQTGRAAADSDLAAGADELESGGY